MERMCALSRVDFRMTNTEYYMSNYLAMPLPYPVTTSFNISTPVRHTCWTSDIKFDIQLYSELNIISPEEVYH
jgi:hypothetical protein